MTRSLVSVISLVGGQVKGRNFLKVDGRVDGIFMGMGEGDGGGGKRGEVVCPDFGKSPGDRCRLHGLCCDTTLLKFVCLFLYRLDFLHA